MALQDVPRCQHVKVNGTQCGSPALRRRRFCFFHDKARREQARIAADASAQRKFDLPLLEDANSVQVELMKVYHMLGSGTIDHKSAGLMLYALQTASINLRHTSLEPKYAPDVVIDLDTVAATCIDGPQWFADDFGTDDEEEHAEDEEKDAETATAADEAAQAKAAPSEKPDQKKNGEKKEVKHVGLEEARKQVQSTIRNWVAEHPTLKPQ